jgi:4'-phosphopantetheinyl transferase
MTADGHPSRTRWTMPAELPSLDPGEVHVWMASVAAWADLESRLEQLLGQAERTRAARFHFPRDRRQFVVAHGLVRGLLAHYAGTTPMQLRFAQGRAGKPALLQPVEMPPLEFNLSHSGDLVLVAVAPGAPVGVDVERWSEDVEFADLIERFFSPSECREFRSLGVEETCSGFFACWSRKEAYIKATGLGVSEGLDYFDVPVAATTPPSLLADRRDPEGPGRWQMMDLALDPGYSGTLVSHSAPERVRRFLLTPDSQIIATNRFR